MNFTEEQNRIFRFVQHENGHGIIDAVAGAGKTTTIMECTQYVPKGHNTLFCAFNKSIAKEINKKFREKGHRGVVVKTVHALGFQILKNNNSTGKEVDLEQDKYKKILKTNEMRDKLAPYYKQIVRINGYDPYTTVSWEKFKVDSLQRKISNRLVNINEKFRTTLTKNDLQEFNKLIKHFGIFSFEEMKRKNIDEEIEVYFKCHKILLEQGNNYSMRTMKIDFADMLYLPTKWKQIPARRFDFVFVDECQDLSKSQFAIAAKYVKPTGRILAVGDPQQSIYGFTGADNESFKLVKKILKAKQLPLTICFRCPQLVIQMAKNIRTDIVGNKSANGIVQEITNDELIKKVKPNDLIISRLKDPITLLAFDFIDRNIRVQIHEEEVKELIKELKNIFKYNERTVPLVNLENGFESLKEKALYRWNKIIEKDAERIVDSTERNAEIEHKKKLLNRKLDFLEGKYEMWEHHCHTIEDVIERIRQFISAPNNSIKLSTIHRAKGLENKRVFILSYDELPFSRLDYQAWEKTQETNLQYVAITRAMEELYLVVADKENEAKNSENEEDELLSLFDSLDFDIDI